MQTIEAMMGHTGLATLGLEELEERRPYVNQIAADISRTWARVLSQRVELEQVEMCPKQLRDHSREDRLAELTDELNALVERVNGYLAEIESLGGTVQEYKRGVVNFPIQRRGRVVMAAWMSTAERIEFWHELSESYEDRKPL